jgi:hypothetical protein
MKSNKFLKAAAFTLSSAGLMLPQSRLQAATADIPAAVQPAAPAVLDVALADGGRMQGQVVDPQGQPVAKTSVAVLHDGKEVALTTTDSEGNFTISGLRSGQHVIVAGDDGKLVRMWSQNTAPPSANSRVMITKGQQIARGQGLLSPTGLMLLGLGGIVAGGLISQNNSDRSGS